MFLLLFLLLGGGEAIAKLMFCQPIEAVHSILSIITFVHLTPLLTLRVGVGGGGLGGCIEPSFQCPAALSVKNPRFFLVYNAIHSSYVIIYAMQ